MQYVPRDGAFLYFRYTEQQTVLVIANGSDQSVQPDWSVYHERVKGFTKARDVITGEVFDLNGWKLAPKDSRVLELLK